LRAAEQIPRRRINLLPRYAACMLRLGMAYRTNKVSLTRSTVALRLPPFRGRTLHHRRNLPYSFREAEESAPLLKRRQKMPLPNC